MLQRRGYPCDHVTSLRRSFRLFRTSYLRQQGGRFDGLGFLGLLGLANLAATLVLSGHRAPASQGRSGCSEPRSRLSFDNTPRFWRARVRERPSRVCERPSAAPRTRTERRTSQPANPAWHEKCLGTLRGEGAETTPSCTGTARCRKPAGRSVQAPARHKIVSALVCLDRFRTGVWIVSALVFLSSVPACLRRP